MAARGSMDMACLRRSALVVVLALVGAMFPLRLKVEFEEVRGTKFWPAMGALPAVFYRCVSARKSGENRCSKRGCLWVT